MPSLKQFVIQSIVIVLVVSLLFKFFHVGAITLMLIGILIGFISSHIAQKMKDRKKSHD